MGSQPPILPYLFASLAKNPNPKSLLFLCIHAGLLIQGPINFTISENITQTSHIICFGCSIIIGICNGIIGVMAFLFNLAILTSIIVKLLRRRKKYIHVNEWITRPLMERYRADVERHKERRPPFIQAFRSQIIY